MSLFLSPGRRNGLSRSRGAAAVSASTAALLAFGFCAAPAALAAPITVNPVSGNHGFLVMTEAEAMLANGRSEGPVAVGGDLEFMDYSVATATAGSFVAPGDDQPSALVVGGTVGTALSGGDLEVRNGGYVKIGDLGDATVETIDTHTAISLTGEGSARITLTTQQPQESVQGSPIDFAAAFAEYRTRSAALASCESTVVPIDTDGGEPFGDFPMAERTARIVLEQGRQNVWNVSAEDLSSLMGIEFGDVTPSADTPLVINVLLPEGSEEDASFLFVPPMTGVGAAEAPYILYNVSGAHNLLLGSAGEALPGTVFAPEATVVALLESGLRGNAIAKRFGVFFPEDVVLTEETETVEEFQALEEEATQGEAEEQLEEVERVRNTLYNVPFAAELELCGTEAPDTGSGDGGQDGQDGQETGGGGTTPPPGEGGQDSTPSPTPVADGPKPGDTTDHKDDGGLPVTGASLVGLIAAAVTAVLGGAAALVLARRRRNA